MSAYLGEAQLLGWSESHNAGAKLALALPDPDDLGPFRTMTVRKGKQAGQMLACLIVEMNDGEDSMASLQRALNTRLAWRGDAKPEGRKVGPLCLLAVQWCKRKDFQDWLFETFVEESGVAPVGEAEDRARSVICSVCGVESRADLDSDRDAASRFNSSIRVPFKERLELAELA